jgi:hypothetical protein
MQRVVDGNCWPETVLGQVIVLWKKEERMKLHILTWSSQTKEKFDKWDCCWQHPTVGETVFF